MSRPRHLRYHLKGEYHLLEKPRWGFIEIILVYLGIMISGIAVAMFGSKFPVLASGFGMGEAGFFLFAFLIQFLTTIGLVYFFAIVLPGGSWADLGIRNAGWRKTLSYGILGGLFLMILVILLGILIQQFQPELPPQYYEQMLRSADKLTVVLLIILAGAVLAPLSEELFYRGMVYPVFRSKLGPCWGAILAGLVFGMVHWDLWRAIPLAVGGAILCYIYEKTNSTLVTTIAHGVWNGVMSLIVYLSLANNLL